MEKSLIEHLGRRWKPISVERFEFEPRSWTEGGMDCLRLNRNCHLCPFHQTHGKSWESPDKANRCYQPVSVQKLLNQGTVSGFRGNYSAHKKTKNWS